MSVQTKKEIFWRNIENMRRVNLLVRSNDDALCVSRLRQAVTNGEWVLGDREIDIGEARRRESYIAKKQVISRNSEVATGPLTALFRWGGVHD